MSKAYGLCSKGLQFYYSPSERHELRQVLGWIETQVLREQNARHFPRLGGPLQESEGKEAKTSSQKGVYPEP